MEARQLISLPLLVASGYALGLLTFSRVHYPIKILIVPLTIMSLKTNEKNIE